MTTFTIDQSAIAKAKAENEKIDLSGINFGMLDMLELWAEREWEKKAKGLPSEWDQGTWMSVRGVESTGTACGTACCLAGKAVAITPGVEILTYDYEDGSEQYAPVTDMAAFGAEREWSYAFDYVKLPDSMLRDDMETCTVTGPDGKAIERVGFGEAGRIILGLNRREANELFSGSNKLDDVKRIVAAIRNGEYRRGEEINVETQPVVQCRVDSQDYVDSLVRGVYVPWGRCVLPQHDDTVQHVFSDR